jgi:hypothetical protein
MFNKDQHGGKKQTCIKCTLEHAVHVIMGLILVKEGRDKSSSCT